jgi:hypothetical protein
VHRLSRHGSGNIATLRDTRTFDLKLPTIIMLALSLGASALVVDDILERQREPASTTPLARGSRA